MSWCRRTQAALGGPRASSLSRASTRALPLSVDHPARSIRVDAFVVKPTRYRVDGCGVLGDDGGDGACVRAGSLTRSRIGSSTNVA